MEAEQRTKMAEKVNFREKIGVKLRAIIKVEPEEEETIRMDTKPVQTVLGDKKEAQLKATIKVEPEEETMEIDTGLAETVTPEIQHTETRYDDNEEFVVMSPEERSKFLKQKMSENVRHDQVNSSLGLEKHNQDILDGNKDKTEKISCLNKAQDEEAVIGQDFSGNKVLSPSISRANPVAVVPNISYSIPSTFFLISVPNTSSSNGVVPLVSPAPPVNLCVSPVASSTISSSSVVPKASPAASVLNSTAMIKMVPKLPQKLATDVLLNNMNGKDPIERNKWKSQARTAHLRLRQNEEIWDRLRVQELQRKHRRREDETPEQRQKRLAAMAEYGRKHKKYAIVIFNGESQVEVVPSSWLFAVDGVRWPNYKSLYRVKKLIRECAKPKGDWKKVPIRILGFANNFKKANEKAILGQDTSSIGSDSSQSEEEDTNRARKRTKPRRYDSASEDDMYVPKTYTRNKKFPVPNTPSSRVSLISSKNLSQPAPPTQQPNPQPAPPTQQLILQPASPTQQLILQPAPSTQQLIPQPAPPTQKLTPQPAPLTQQLIPQPVPPTQQLIPQPTLPTQQETPEPLPPPQEGNTVMAMLDRVFRCLGEIQNDLQILKTEQAKMQCTLSEVLNKNEPIQGLFSLPDGLCLPVETDDQLIQMNYCLRENKSLTSDLVRYLYGCSSGKTTSSFLLSVSRKILPRSVAKLYSRLGRKGKKAFESVEEVYNAIIAAAALKFPEATKEDLVERFGRVLASAPDWDCSGRN